MALYTRNGDTGETMLYGGKMVQKTDARIHAYGSVDELDSLLGVILAEKCSHELAEKLREIQQHLYTVKADLATPIDYTGTASRVQKELVTLLEHWIDSAEGRVAPLAHFIIPGGTRTAALLHQARTVCRRAERWVFAVSEREKINEYCVQYLNRLGDLFFALARLINAEAGVKEKQARTE